ncbi:MAG: Plug domain-containing protein [Gemmatimonadetes bacterium]|nr:Plug domain-containing protein [Gemmatimonadota bacterium]
MPPDTAAATSPEPDSLAPPPRLVEFADAVGAGWSAGVWEWGPEALLASGAVSLTDLLEQIPGVVPVRSGLFGQPQAVSAFGMTGGRLELVLDGYALDPLHDATFDLSRLELVNLERVRVERRLDRLRIEIHTLAPGDRRAYSRVEVGTGDFDTNLFRGLLLVPRALIGPLSLGVDRLDTDGIGRRQNATSFAGWLKWGLVFGRLGLQFELRQETAERGGEVVLPGKSSRRDLVLRARGQLLGGLVAELFHGWSSGEDQPADSAVERSGTQAGARVLARGARWWAGATLRRRSLDPLPENEAELSAGVRWPGRLTLGGDVGWADWRDAGGATSYEVRAELGPFGPARAFGSLARGERGVPFFPDTAAANDTAFGSAARFTAAITERNAARAGLELARGGFRLGAAALTVVTDSVPGFLLPFDSTPRLYAGGTVRGWELFGRLPLFWHPLSLEGAYNAWISGFLWPYLPAHNWRASFVYHHSPLKSGNLELLLRLDGHERGAMDAPRVDGALERVDALRALDLYLQIRVLDLRTFLRWENITHRLRMADLPDRALPGQRVFWGVKWQFWN